MSWHLAQLNIGRLLAPTDAPETAEFMATLEPLNALADGAPGFVWRLQTEDGDATAIRPYPDDLMIVNMSTWVSLEALADYVYGDEHRAVMVKRRQWFERMREAYLVLWWVPAGQVPSVAEAQARLAHLQEHGSTAHAFTFREPFPSPGSDDGVATDDRWSCGV